MPTTTTQTATLSITTTTTSTTTKTATQTVTTTTSTTATTQQVHTVVFQQLGSCSNPEFWGIPWAVTIGDTTEVQPPGTPLPPDNGSLSGEAGTLNENFSVIAFALPDGSYNFKVDPSTYFQPNSGVVDVNGADVLVQIGYETSCTATITTTVMTTMTTSTATVAATKNTVSLSGFSIATGSTSLGEPSPYLSGYINVNAKVGVTWSSYALYTNNNYCGTHDFSTPTTMNQFTYSFQGSPVRYSHAREHIPDHIRSHIHRRHGCHRKRVSARRNRHLRYQMPTLCRRCQCLRGRRTGSRISSAPP